jgi:hypothetical protein
VFLLDYEDRLDENGDIDYEGSVEFDNMNTPGYVCVLLLSEGCRVFDMSQYYGRIQLDREKEFILLPKHLFIPKYTTGKYMHWYVIPTK